MKTAALPSNLAIASSQPAIVDGAPIKRVHLMPMGRVTTNDGRGPWFVKDAAAAQAVIDRTREWLGNRGFMMDYDHQTVFGAVEGVGGTARAAGWIDPASLTVEADGIWGNVEWTPAAAEALAAREYRYVSPVFLHDKATGDVVALRNAALVNIPALNELAAAAAAQLETSMDYSKIAAALGLPATASEAEVLAKCSAMTAAPADTAAAAATLGLAATATTAEIVSAAAKFTPDPAKFVPAEALVALNAQLKTINAERANSMVAAAIASGKLVPALKDWGTQLFERDEVAFASYIAAAPTILGAGDSGAGAAKPGDADALNETELATAKSMGLTAAQFLAAKKDS